MRSLLMKSNAIIILCLIAAIMLGVLAIVYSQDDPILWDSSLTEYEDIAPGTAQAHTELAYDFLSWFEKEFPKPA